MYLYLRVCACVNSAIVVVLLLFQGHRQNQYCRLVAFGCVCGRGGSHSSQSKKFKPVKEV